MDNSKLHSETEYLFGLKWADDLPDEATDERTDRADSLIAEYGWPKVFEVWESYLYKKCITPESVMNFSMWFWLYSGHDYPIPDPHKFQGTAERN